MEGLPLPMKLSRGGSEDILESCNFQLNEFFSLKVSVVIYWRRWLSNVCDKSKGFAVIAVEKRRESQPWRTKKDR